MSKTAAKQKGFDYFMKYLFLLFAFCLLPSATAAAHRFHTSFTRIDYNAEQKLAEITIQVFAHDLEAALVRQEGKRIDLEKTKQIDEIILKYLANRFVLKNTNGEQKRLRWIGMEQKTDSVWLYVETETPEGLTGATLENRIFQEMLSKQVNLVTTRYNNTKTDLVFKPNDKVQNLIVKKEQN